ncbi:WAP four-disulfide core domain protein 3-like [Salarias fasciatus]|uniref:WAP four-disulfide core domain protein 3-like n=1 Tax=Salarias fasciatus TaxID=181472 RepID=UPI001176A2C3|nr:WAP four-disulfide core domain protein 3-like [Salarias fasciatus]
MEKIYLTVSLLVFAFVHFGPVSALSGLNPGGCPREENGVVGICALIPRKSCFTDDDCSGGLKCCSSGCGRKCVAVAPILEVKPGVCPQFSGPGICIHECNHDYECERNQKCCSTGCGNVCMGPLRG